jgi:hypothetical protein
MISRLDTKHDYMLLYETETSPYDHTFAPVGAVP